MENGGYLTFEVRQKIFINELIKSKRRSEEEAEEFPHILWRWLLNYVIPNQLIVLLDLLLKGKSRKISSLLRKNAYSKKKHTEYIHNTIIQSSQGNWPMDVHFPFSSSSSYYPNQITDKNNKERVKNAQTAKKLIIYSAHECLHFFCLTT